MEYCDNGDLCTFLNKIKKQRKNENYFLETDFVWKLFIQMSIGLYYIHSKKIIHRDIKTLNIFLTKNLDAKIGDLGVAKILENTNHAMTFIGTPYYVSPEMCKNKPYNEKSDIWALGCILYELLTFNHPFTATNQAALFIKILKNKYNPFPPGVPDDLKNMVDFILNKDYELRPSMKDIITSNSFQINAINLKLDEDLKEVLGINVLPIHSIKKEISNYSLYKKERNLGDNDKDKNNNNINTSHTFVIQLNSSKKNKDGKINIKNQKNDLINSRSLNDILNKYYMSGKKEAKKKKLYLNYHFTNKSHLSPHKLIKNEFHNSKNKRTKSDFNCLSPNNDNINQKNETKITEDKLNENHKISNNLLNNKFINLKRSVDRSPRKSEKILNTSKKSKENLEKKMNTKNNSNLNENIISIKNNNSKYNNYIKYCETSKNKIRKNSKSVKDNILQTDLRNNKSPKIRKSYQTKTEKTNQKNDIISEEEFLKELQNTIKNNPNIIKLNDLLNFNFNLEDSKNLNTTSATSLIGKIERSSAEPEEKEKYDLILKNVKEEIENEEEDYLNELCDEFTKTERIKRSEPFLSKTNTFF